MEELDRAVTCCKRAIPQWVKLSAAGRAALLNKWTDILERRAQEFDELETVKTGKPIIMSETFDIPFSIDNLRFNSTWNYSMSMGV